MEERQRRERDVVVGVLRRDQARHHEGAVHEQVRVGEFGAFGLPVVPDV